MGVGRWVHIGLFTIGAKEPCLGTEYVHGQCCEHNIGGGDIHSTIAGVSL